MNYCIFPSALLLVYIADRPETHQTTGIYDRCGCGCRECDGDSSQHLFYRMKMSDERTSLCRFHGAHIFNVINWLTRVSFGFCISEVRGVSRPEPLPLPCRIVSRALHMDPPTESTFFLYIQFFKILSEMQNWYLARSTRLRWMNRSIVKTEHLDQAG